MGRTVMEAGTMKFWATELAELGAAARRLPPTWQHGDAWPILYGDVTLGVVLPGLGIQMDVPLSALGVHRVIPYVTERSLWERCMDRLGDARLAAGLAAACVGAAVLSNESLSAPLMAGTLTTFNSIVAAIGAGRSDIVLCGYAPFSTSFNNQAGQWAFPYDLFRPAAFAFSTGLAATAPSRSTSGALNSYAQAPGIGQHQILQAVHEVTNNTSDIVKPSLFMFMDLLYESASVLMNTTSTQTLGTAALTRYTSGLGVFMMSVGTVVSNNNTVTATVTYTNSAGTGSRTTTIAHNGNAGQGQYMTKPPFQAWPFVTPQSGDIGVRSIQSVAWNSALGTGEMAMTLVKPLAVAWARKNSEFITTDYIHNLHPVVVDSDACLIAVPRLPTTSGSFRTFESTLALRFTSV